MDLGSKSFITPVINYCDYEEFLLETTHNGKFEIPNNAFKQNVINKFIILEAVAYKSGEIYLILH